MKILASTKSIQKKTRIEPAIRNNTQFKERIRLTPSNGFEAKGMKIKGSQGTFVSPNEPVINIQEGAQAGVNFQYYFFIMNKKRHILGGSDQG